MTAYLFLLASCISAAETVTLTPAMDSDIYRFTDAPTSSIHTLGVSASGAGAPHSQRTLIKFDLSSLTIPAAEIDSAVLHLYVLAPDPNYGSLGPGEISIFRQSNAWTISNPTLRWSQLDPAAPAGSLIVAENSADTWLKADVTSTVVSWTSGTSANHGFLLQAASETATPYLNVTFASMELAAAGVAPRLVITRAAPKPPTLVIQADSQNVILQWPVAASSGWVLQSSPAPAGPWTPDAIPAQLEGSHWRSIRPLAPPARFFRLARE